MFTRLPPSYPANAHLLLMCILGPRQHSRASNNIYNGCLVSPRYHQVSPHISSLLYPPTSHWPCSLVSQACVLTGTDLWSKTRYICRGKSAPNCPVNQILIIAVFVFTRGGGWGSRLEIYLSVINHRTRAMNEKMSWVRDVRSHNQLARRHSSHLLTDSATPTAGDCFVFPSGAQSSKSNLVHLWSRGINSQAMRNSLLCSAWPTSSLLAY